MKFSAREVDTCHKKRVYDTKNKARNAAGVIAKAMGNNLKAPLNVYHCPVCRKYHLTHLSKDQMKAWEQYNKGKFV